MPRKVGFVKKLKAKELVQYCPFCRTDLSGKGKGHTCPVATAANSAKLPDPSYCPLCGQPIEREGHECPTA